MTREQELLAENEKLREELADLRGKLPKTADRVAITPGMNVYISDHIPQGGGREYRVLLVKNNGKIFVQDTSPGPVQQWWWQPIGVFSTEAAAEESKDD